MQCNASSQFPARTYAPSLTAEL
jgi:hypothetical protein